MNIRDHSVIVRRHAIIHHTKYELAKPDNTSIYYGTIKLQRIYKFNLMYSRSMVEVIATPWKTRAMMGCRSNSQRLLHLSFMEAASIPPAMGQHVQLDRWNQTHHDSYWWNRLARTINSSYHVWPARLYHSSNYMIQPIGRRWACSVAEDPACCWTITDILKGIRMHNRVHVKLGLFGATTTRKGLRRTVRQLLEAQNETRQELRIPTWRGDIKLNLKAYGSSIWTG